MATTHAILVGAGIGGLTAALAMQKAGVKVTIYEQAPALAEVGAGLTVSPNATHGLEYVGLGKFMADNADTPESGAGLHYQTGEVLYTTQEFGGFRKKYGAEYYQIHRADIHEGLAAAVRKNDPDAIKLGHKFASFTQDGKTVTATFENGATATGDVMIGCDGVRSGVRGALFGREAPDFTGQVAFRGVVPADPIRHLLVPTRSAVAIGPGRIFTRYYLRHGKEVNYVGIARTDKWKEEGWSIPATPEEMLSVYGDFHENITGIIKSTPPGKLFKWAMFGRPPIEQWTVGRVSLLGDAAHPMLPFLDMGAAMSIEDGVLLGRAFGASSSVEEALTRYEAARKQRANKVLIDSRTQGEIYQSDDPTKLRGKPSGEMRLGLFDYNPATVPV
ncbi:MAG: FAD-dependent monooxygenase [Rhodobacteraceae bacterium]|nr:FAD-dependent monooxygenase [Paracoccaceae bacterium]